MTMEPLQTGDRVFHPVYGQGAILGQRTVEQAGQSKDYYAVGLADGAVLLVPVDRAEVLGLRRPINGLAEIAACLQTPAQPLPDAPLMRVNELRARWKAPQPWVITQTVRDLIARQLTPSDVKWLSQALERLSAEAAIVDGIEPAQASAAIQDAVDQLKPG